LAALTVGARRAGQIKFITTGAEGAFHADIALGHPVTDPHDDHAGNRAGGLELLAGSAPEKDTLTHRVDWCLLAGVPGLSSRPGAHRACP